MDLFVFVVICIFDDILGLVYRIKNKWRLIFSSKRRKSKSITDYLYSKHELGKYNSQDWKEFIDHLYKINFLSRRDYNEIIYLISIGMTRSHLLKDK